jgi:hypothetical protein
MSAPKIPVSTMSLRTSPSKKSLRATGTGNGNGNGTDGHVKIPSVNDDLDKGGEEDFGTVIHPKVSLDLKLLLMSKTDRQHNRSLG